MSQTGIKRQRTKPNSRQIKFAHHIVAGKSQADAYKAVYQPQCPDKRAGEKGCMLAKHPAVMSEIARLRAKSEVKTLLTLNDRLGLLAKSAQVKPKTAADRNAQARVIEVYSKISGDHAPERVELTGRDGSPLKVEANATVTISKRDKIAAILQKTPAAP